MTFTPAEQRRTLLTLAPVAALVLYVETMVVPALPLIATEFGVGLAETSWILTIYLLVGAASPPVLGRLGDLWGKKRVLLAVMALYTVSLLASAHAPTLGLLIATRAIQGLGFTMFPLAFGIVRDAFPAPRMAVAQGVISAMFGVGGAAGLGLGSLITHHHGWRATYTSVLPFAVLLWLAILLLIRPTGVRRRVRVDWAGALLLILTVLPVLYAVVRAPAWGFADARLLILLAASAFFAALLVHRETTARAPLIDPALLRNRDLLHLNLIGVAVGFSMFSLFQTLPGLIQTPRPVGFGGTVLAAGLTQLPMSLATLATGPLNGLLIGRIGPRRPLLWGLMGLAAAFLLLLAFHDALWHVMLIMALFGAALSMTMVATVNLVVLATPVEATGVSTAMNQTFRIAGGSLGPATAAFFLATHTAPLEFQGVVQDLPTRLAYDLVFLTAGLMVLAAALLALRMVRRYRPHPPRQGSGVRTPRAAAPFE